MSQRGTPEKEERHQKVVQEASRNGTEELFYFNDEDMLYYVEKDVGYILNVAIYKKRLDCVFRYYISPYKNIYVHIPLEVVKNKAGRNVKCVTVPTRDGPKKYTLEYLQNHSFAWNEPNITF